MESDDPFVAKNFMNFGFLFITQIVVHNYFGGEHIALGSFLSTQLFILFRNFLEPPIKYMEV